MFYEIIEDLRGTCEDVGSYLESNGLEHLQDDPDFLAELDNTIFRCECCGWWCPISEVSESDAALICTDCADE